MICSRGIARNDNVKWFGEVGRAGVREATYSSGRRYFYEFSSPLFVVYYIIVVSPTRYRLMISPMDHWEKER